MSLNIKKSILVVFLTLFAVPALASPASAGEDTGPGENETSAPTILIVFDGQCLDTFPINLSKNLANARAATCDGTRSQNWMSTKDRELTLGGLCLDVKDGKTDKGTPVRLFTCNKSKAQKWYFDQTSSPADVNIKSWDGRCLDVKESSSQGVQVNKCSTAYSDSGQLFTWPGARRIEPLPEGQYAYVERVRPTDEPQRTLKAVEEIQSWRLSAFVARHPLAATLPAFEWEERDPYWVNGPFSFMDWDQPDFCTKSFDKGVSRTISFKPACVRHDFCIDNLRAVGMLNFRLRTTCDDQFLEDLSVICNRPPEGLGERGVIVNQCLSSAKVYHKSVSAVTRLFTDK